MQSNTMQSQEMEDQKKAIRLAALNLLARREHSVHELTEKLSIKRWPKLLIHEVLAALKAEGLQDDQRFTENYTRRKAAQGIGPIKIAYELANKGISQTMIEKNLEAYENTWQNIIQQVINNKTRQHKLTPLDHAQSLTYKLKLQRFLQQRGFPVNLIIRASQNLEPQ